MADETTLAEAPVSDDTKTETIAPVDDGIIDLDAPEPEVKETTDDDDKAKSEGDGEPKADVEDKPKKPSGAQRAKIREARLLSELNARDQELETLRRQTPAKDDSDKPPKEEDFNGDFFAFQTAKTAFEVRQVIRDENRKVEDSKRASQQTEQARERTVAHLERVEDAREVIADFDKVMETMKGVSVRDDVIAEVMSSDQSALIAYHLAQNPHELQAMNTMSARELARAMGRLEATVRLPSPKKQTTAPPPLSAIKGGASPRSSETDLQAWLKKTYGR